MDKLITCDFRVLIGALLKGKSQYIIFFIFTGVDGVWLGIKMLKST